MFPSGVIQPGAKEAQGDLLGLPKAGGSSWGGGLVPREQEEMVGY